MITEDRPLSYLSDNDIPAEAFSGDEETVYEFVREHVINYEKMPDLETVEEETAVKLADFPNEPIDYWADGVKNRHTTKLLLDGYDEVKKKVVEGDTEGAVVQLQSIAMNMAMRSEGDTIVTLGQMVPGILKYHDVRQRAGIMKGTPFGIEYLDEISDGAQPGDTIAFVGRPGVGKSYVMGMMALYSYLYHDDIPLVVTMEMLSEQWARRTVAMQAGVTANLIRLGQLSKWGRRALEDRSNAIREDKIERPYYILQGKLGSTIEDLAMRIQELRPTVVYIDGAYLMQTKGHHKSKWERVSEVAEYQKMIARDFNIPIIGSWQFNRKGPGSLGNIGFSDVIGQLASIVCAIKNDRESSPDLWKLKSYKIFDLLKGREGERGSVRVLYDMGRMEIKQDAVLTGYQMEEEDEEDGY
jgi:replicative DNA helicase